MGAGVQLGNVTAEASINYPRDCNDTNIDRATSFLLTYAYPPYTIHILEIAFPFFVSSFQLSCKRNY